MARGWCVRMSFGVCVFTALFVTAPAAGAADPGYPFATVSHYDIQGDLMGSDDFNSDGHEDLLVEAGSEVTPWLGDGSGAFTGRGETIPLPELRDLAVADMDGDDIPDLVVSRSAGSATAMSILLGDGQGSFRTSDSITIQSAAEVEVGSVSGSGPPDVIVRAFDPPERPGQPSAGSMTSYPTDGSGRFCEPVDSPIAQPDALPDPGEGDYAAFYGDMTSGDLDGDGRTDVAFGYAASIYRSDGVLVTMLGQPDGRFVQEDTAASVAGVNDFSIAHLDDDPTADLIGNGSNLSTSSLQLTSYLGTGGGGFLNGSTLPSGPAGAGYPTPAIADFDRDGNEDVVAPVVTGSGATYFWAGNGDGSFAAPVGDDSGERGYSIVTGDFDSDGYADVAVAGTAGMTVMLNVSGGSRRVGLRLGKVRIPDRAGALAKRHGSFTARCAVDCRVRYTLKLTPRSTQRLSLRRQTLSTRVKRLDPKMRAFELSIRSRPARRALRRHGDVRITGRLLVKADALDPGAGVRRPQRVVVPFGGGR